MNPHCMPVINVSTHCFILSSDSISGLQTHISPSKLPGWRREDAHDGQFISNNRFRAGDAMLPALCAQSEQVRARKSQTSNQNQNLILSV